MRWLVLAILLAPGASAASQIHLTYDGEDYVATFRTGGAAPLVDTLNGSVEAKAVGGGWWRASIPNMTGGYAIDGRSFPLQPPPAPHEPTRIVFVADMGVDANATRVARAIANHSPDLVLIGGDLSYAHADVGMWDDWFDLMEPLAARVPIMPAFGNHEHYCTVTESSFRRCDEENARWGQHFALPNAPARFYAFDWGPVRVTTLDTEAYIDAADERATDPAEQEAFLRRSLSDDHDRWDLVMFHRPLRTTLDRAGAALPPADASRLEGLLASSDVVLQAHVHAYERSVPGANGTIYVTSGGGGRELYDAWGPEAPWLATRAAVHHFVVLDVSPGRIAARTVDLANRTIDSFEMTRDVPASLRAPPPSPAAATTPTPPPPAAPTTRGTPTPNESVATLAPADHRGTPVPPWVAALAVAFSLTFRASRRRRARRARG